MVKNLTALAVDSGQCTVTAEKLFDEYYTQKTGASTHTTLFFNIVLLNNTLSPYPPNPLPRRGRGKSAGRCAPRDPAAGIHLPRNSS